MPKTESATLLPMTRLLDSRRLTGPNLLWQHPGAVLEIACEAGDAARLIALWRAEVRQLLDAVGWNRQRIRVRRFAGGVDLAISAPLEALYSAVELNEAAWNTTLKMLRGRRPPAPGRAVPALRKQIARESGPRSGELIAQARRHAVPLLLDSETLSLGLGCHSQSWLRQKLPRAADVDWSRLGRIPVALVTGTNGKTTTVRLLAAIGRAAGYCTGVSTTDWLQVGGEIIERDDYAGPEGARRILRDRRVELAVLETARGGLLRRGLALDHAEAGLITNIASDHLGDSGIDDLEQLADVKWVLTRALDRHSHLVLNADDPRLVARAGSARAQLIWFSDDPRHPVLRAHRAAGGTVCTVLGGAIVLRDAKHDRRVVPISEVPITLGGAARHNVANALGATALAHALGLPVDAIATGLRGFTVADNPGRAMLLQLDGVHLLLDFAHNPHGVQAMITLAASLPATRRLLVIGQAGDRSDTDIRDFARATGGLQFDRILLKRLDKYRRGREPGETAALMRKEFLAMGYAARSIAVHQSELGAVQSALRWARPGDLCLLLVHENREAVLAWLDRQRERER